MAAWGLGLPSSALRIQLPDGRLRDGRGIVINSGGQSSVWDTRTGQVLGRSLGKLQTHRYGVAALTPDGRNLFIPGPEWRLQRLSIPDLKPSELDPPVSVLDLPFETQQHIAPDKERVLPDGTRVPAR